MLFEEERRAFTALAYVRGPARFYQSAYRRILAAIDLHEGAWLDIGCGPGWLCIHAASSRPEVRVLGIDSSIPMLEEARRNHPGLPNLSFELMDAARMTFADGSFQVVTAVQTAHHWHQTDRILAEAWRVLEPGGRLFLYEANPAGDIPVGWIDRSGPWPPDLMLRLRWRRYGMGDRRWLDLKARVAASPFGQAVVDEPHGFYRRLVCTRALNASAAGEASC